MPTPEQYLRVFQYYSPELQDIPGHFFKSPFMANRSAVLLPETDRHHFHQSAFHFSMKIRVWFDPSDHDNSIRLGGVLVNTDRSPLSLIPTCTVSMLEQTGAPVVSCVIPYPASTSS